MGNQDRDEMKKNDNHVDGFYWEIKIEMKRKLSENVHVEVLGVRNNGEPIFPKFSNLVSFSVDKRKEYDFAESCNHQTPFSYYDEGCKPPLVIIPFGETLLWLDMD